MLLFLIIICTGLLGGLNVVALVGSALDLIAIHSGVGVIDYNPNTCTGLGGLITTIMLALVDSKEGA